MDTEFKLLFIINNNNYYLNLVPTITLSFIITSIFRYVLFNISISIRWKMCTYVHVHKRINRSNEADQ